jgi:type I restriction-modification system DNA methylase subunit
MSTETTSLESARQRIEKLVERFSANIDSYKSQGYNETQTRNEFINPFFDALGWDIYNRLGYAEAYKDVIHEDAIKIGGFTKAPDYCFRIGGQRKFFVEAKKPFVNLKSDPAPYFQLRRYAYSAKLPLSILTDFEELAILDCRSKPSQGDKASTGRIAYYGFQEYPDKLEEIFATFSKDAVLKGSFDRYVSSSTAKRGTGEVDKEFLKEIEGWRDLLARSIALRNPGLSQRDLNYAVQATIDRIIFLRICEDRGIEEYGVLQGLQNGSNVYPRLCQLFQKADERYNSGLFHFREERGRGSADELSLSLAIDDNPLKEILRALYYPESPYEFSVLPVDILGQVYEQFLGKVIRLTAGHQAKVEDKPEVKKAGGVYYTPTYIVDYIVENTVGKLLEGKTPKTAEKLGILDPACGSGSFLIGAYEYLMAWHRDWYTENEPEKWAAGKSPRLFQGRAGWQLTTPEKKRILLNNIYGVDIDSQAVEVTKLSLLLKVLEEENAETIGKNLTLFHERALPDLSKNVKCGNSLIGSDFYEGQQLGRLGEEERWRINAFDWKDEFPEIFSGKNPGFDAVIGNPPYVQIKQIPWRDRKIYERKFKSAVGRFNIFYFFLELPGRLAKLSGISSFIVPDRLLLNTQCSELRKWLLEEQTIHEIDSFREGVFKAVVDSIIITYQNINRSQDEILVKNRLTPESLSQEQGIKIPVSYFLDSPSKQFDLSYKPSIVRLWKKIKIDSKPLGDLADVRDGIIQGKIADKLFLNKPLDKDSKPLLFGKDVTRYSVCFNNKWVNYKPSEMMQIEAQRRGKGVRLGLWMRKREIFERPKILTRQTADEIIAAYDSDKIYYSNTLHGTTIINRNFDPNYVLGLLNSKLITWFYQSTTAERGKVFAQIKIALLRLLPIKTANLSQQKPIIGLVEQIVELNKRLQAAKTALEKDSLQRQIDATDRQIDRLVYELYELTDDEIKIVEGPK